MKLLKRKKAAIFLPMIIVLSLVLNGYPRVAANSQNKITAIASQHNAAEISPALIAPTSAAESDAKNNQKNPLVKNYISDLQKLEKVSSTDAPVSLDCTYKFKDNVVVLEKGELSEIMKQNSGNEDFDSMSAEDKITRTFSADKSIVDKYIPKIGSSSVVYDESMNLAACLKNDESQSSSKNVVFSKPQLSDIVTDFNLNPKKKTVRLNKGNLRYSEQNGKVLESLTQTNNANTSSSTTTVKSATSPDIIDVEIPDDAPMFEGYTSEGTPYKIKLSGYLKLRSIDVDPSYSLFNGYSISFNTGIDAKLSAKFSVFQGTIAIPLYGIDIPAGPAHVGGGIYLLINNRGQFTLTINTESHIGASAGIYGSTCFGVPTSIHPFFEPKLDFSANSAFIGQVSGDITVGPLVQISAFGFDLVSADVTIGAGVDTKEASDNFLDCDVYGLISANAAIFDMGINLVNYKLPLYHFRKENTMGYIITFYDIDAYTKHISGKLEYGANAAGELDAKPLADADINVSVIRAKRTDKFVPITLHTNQNGEFDMNLKDELYKGDIVKVTSVHNPITKKDEKPNFKTATPTIPFNAPVIEYSDFFNNSIKGYVAPAFKKNKVTGESSIVYFDKPIELWMAPHSQKSKTCVSVKPKLGEFAYNTEIKPYDVAQPVLKYNDFEIPGQSVVADTNFVGTRVITDKKSEQVKNNPGAYLTTFGEQFFIINSRGSKPLESLAVYKPYKYVYKHHENEFFSSTTNVEELKNIYRKIVPVSDSTASGNNDATKLNISLDTDGQLLNDYQQFNSFASLLKLSIKGATSKIDTKFSILYTPAITEDNDSIMPIKAGAADKGSENLNPVTWTGDYAKVSVNIEGEDVAIKDANDADPGNSAGGKGQYPKSPDVLINEKIWSVINPNPVEKNGMNIYTPNNGAISAKANVQSAWTKTLINSASKNGFIDMKAAFQYQKLITRDEFCGLLVKLYEKFSRNPIKNYKNPFKDTSSTNAQKAYKLGIVKPNGKGMFSPNGVVSRQDAYCMIVKCIKAAYPTLNIKTPTGKIMSYKDKNQISNSALESVNYCINNKIYIKNSAQNVQPLKSLTSEEAVSLVELAYEQF